MANARTSITPTSLTAAGLSQGVRMREGELRHAEPVAALAQWSLQGSTVVLREAAVRDVPAIVKLLAADQLGATRDGAATYEDLHPYLRAFAALDADPAHLLLVADDGDQLVTTMQLSFLPGLARGGALRAQDRGGAGQGGPAQPGSWGGDVPVGDRGGAASRLRPGAADHGQVTSRRAPLLRAARVPRLARGAQAAASLSPTPSRSGTFSGIPLSHWAP